MICDCIATGLRRFLATELELEPIASDHRCITRYQPDNAATTRCSHDVNKAFECAPAHSSPPELLQSLLYLLNIEYSLVQ